MKAIVYSNGGSPDRLKLAEIEKPAPADDEVLIKVRAASVNPADWRLASFNPFLRRMMFAMVKIKGGRPGIDVAGQVESVGASVTRFKPGDEVFGTAYGAFAEYACSPESRLAIKPDSVTFEQAASVGIAGITALQGLRDKGQLEPGQSVLINGAAGGVGTFAVQLAKSMGAHVTGVCSTRNVEMVRSLGADRVIDYTTQDFTRDTQRYDLLLDNVGNRPLSACRRLLKPKGRLIIAGGPKKAWAILVRSLNAHLVSWFRRQKKTIMFIAKSDTVDLTAMAELMKAGKVTPVIDRRYSLGEVPEALRYLEQGHARAKVVITVA